MTEFDRQMTQVANEVMEEVCGMERVSNDMSNPGYRKWVNIEKPKKKIRRLNEDNRRRHKGEL